METSQGTKLWLNIKLVLVIRNKKEKNGNFYNLQDFLTIILISPSQKGRFFTTSLSKFSGNF